MIPVVTLVGQPNVGKSTLFNRLTSTHDALVSNFSGLTRDRKYGRAKVSGCEFIVIDTGGIDGTIDGTEGDIKNRIVRQSLLAIEEADVVLFMVDARAGVMPADHHIANRLRSLDKVTFLVVNKTDGLNPDLAGLDFYVLGFDKIHSIAASHGHGVTNLLETALLPWMYDVSVQNVNKENESLDWSELAKEDYNPINFPIKLAIVGSPNVGKSTLTNRILGEDRVIIYDMPGTTRDSIYIPMERDGCEYILIDTAGMRKRGKITNIVEKFSVIKTMKAIEEANVVMLLIDARTGISDQDLSLLGFILKSGRSLVIVVNKWDGLSQESKDKVKKTIDFRLGFIDFTRMHFISALHGNGVGNILKSVTEAYKYATKRVNTSTLTRIMNMAVDAHQPPLLRGRRVNLKYAHAGGYNPPIIVIHGNGVKSLPDSYKRYLMNYFRHSLKIMGTPIYIQFKEGDNPYAYKRNVLTPNQKRKRKRLMAHLKKK